MMVTGKDTSDTDYHDQHHRICIKQISYSRFFVAVADAVHDVLTVSVYLRNDRSSVITTRDSDSSISFLVQEITATFYVLVM